MLYCGKVRICGTIYGQTIGKIYIDFDTCISETYTENVENPS